MSNSISALSSTTNAGYLRQAEAHDKHKRVRQDSQDMQSLSTALQAGDLSAAQSAYATLKQNSPNLTAQTDTSQSKSPRAQAMSDLGAALDSGDVSKAQTAFAELQKTMRGHHGHRQHGISDSTGGDASPAAQSFDEALTSATATGSSVNPEQVAGSVLNAVT